MSKRRFVYIAAIAALACSGHSTVYQVITIDGDTTATAGAGGGASGGSPSASGGGGAVSAAGSPAISAGANAGGSAGDAAQAGDSNASGGTNLGGDTSVAGAGGEAAGGEGCGSLIANLPADCHATIACAGTSVVDQNNVPTPTNRCVVGTCNSSGIPGTAPAAVGTACSAAGGGSWCDGAGKCVPCLQPSDCKDGQVCSAAHQCVAGACTDVDCGGTCPACGNGKKCLADADCHSFACDAVTLTCITPQCQDHRQDGVETDADCGGGFCPGCVLGKGCSVNEDCTSLACDALKLTCVSNPCVDHHTDGFETDIDCGGGGCGACNVGQTCKVNFDCVSGHFCNAQHVCQ